MKDVLAVLHNQTQTVIELRKQLLDTEDGDYTDKVDEFGVKQKRAFLDSLIIAQKKYGFLTDANINEEVTTIMFGVY